MNHTLEGAIPNREKISAKDIPRQTVDIILYAHYNENDVLKEYQAQYRVQGRSLTISNSAKTLEELADTIAYDVVWDQQVIKPWYDIEFTEGPLPKHKAPPGFEGYTGKPPEGTRKELIELLREKKEEIAHEGLERYVKQQQTHKEFVKGRPVSMPRYRRI